MGISDHTCISCASANPAGSNFCRRCGLALGAAAKATALDLMATPAIDRLNDYEILGEVGRGGMGTVYRARHRNLGLDVALKVIRKEVSTNDHFVRRFFREAKILYQLDHPNLPRYYEFGKAQDGRYFLAMEFLHGRSLVAFKEAPLTELLPLLVQICDALSTIHALGIVHRDLSPDNILVVGEEDLKVKIIDFGVAKTFGASDSVLTQAGTFMGKLEYASPEQLGQLPEGEKIDARSDIYSLGILLFQLFAGALPFRGTTPLELIRAHLLDEPPNLERLTGGNVPRSLALLIRDCLVKDRAQRIGSALTVRQRLLEVQEEVTAARKANAQRPVSRIREFAPSKPEPLERPPLGPLPDELTLRLERGSTPRPEEATRQERISPFARRQPASEEEKLPSMPSLPPARLPPRTMAGETPVPAAPIEPSQPSQRRTPWRMAIFSALVMAALAGTWWGMRDRRQEIGTQPSASATPATTAEPPGIGAPPTPEASPVTPTPLPVGTPAATPAAAEETALAARSGPDSMATPESSAVSPSAVAVAVPAPSAPGRETAAPPSIAASVSPMPISPTPISPVPAYVPAEWVGEMNTAWKEGAVARARSAAGRILAEDPAHPAALQIAARAGEIDDLLKAGETALGREDLSAAKKSLGSALALNPQDSRVSALAREISAREREKRLQPVREAIARGDGKKAQELIAALPAGERRGEEVAELSRAAERLLPRPSPSEKPVASPEPHAQPAVAGGGEAGIREALARYEAAYESLDAAAVRRVWPALSWTQEGQLAKAFSTYRAQELSVSDVKILALSPDRATVTCRVHRSVTPKAGKKTENTSATQFRLHKADSVWVIDAVEEARNAEPEGEEFEVVFED